MKRQKRKSAPAKKTSAASAQAAPRKKRISRRDMLGLAKFLGVGAVVLGGGGYYFASKVMAQISEGDLTKLGNGIPTIVQVHDPTCPVCSALQRETRDAIADLDDVPLQYLVANLNDPKGRAFARSHTAGRMTLLFFDGSGRMQGRITGAQRSEELVPVFQAHAEAG